MALLAGCGSRPAPPAATPSPFVRIWEGDTRQIADHWVIPSLHSRADGGDLEVDVAVAVGAMTELATNDIAIELRAGTALLTCEAPRPLSFTETLAITAQAEIHCTDPAHAPPTELVVAIRGTRATFPIRTAI